MAKAVLTTKVDPTYDDIPEVRYHFPRTYLNTIKRALGDWIVYYEPRRSSGQLSISGGRQSYFAIARLVNVVPDPNKDGHFYAYVGDFLEFDRPVPFREGGTYYERSLRKADGTTNKGQFGRSVRILEDAEYHQILTAGFAKVLETADRPFADDINTVARPPAAPYGASVDPEEPEEQYRQIITSVSHRRFRDRAFSSAIKSAYGDTCAISGLRIINGGGRSEAQAAHIRPVKDNGPDSVCNGIALCGTMHWMFDRGLISIDDDFSLLFAQKSMPDNVLRMINSERRLQLPELRQHHPHPQFLEYHRDCVFKGWGSWRGG